MNKRGNENDLMKYPYDERTCSSIKGQASMKKKELHTIVKYF